MQLHGGEGKEGVAKGNTEEEGEDNSEPLSHDEVLIVKVMESCLCTSIVLYMRDNTSLLLLLFY